ncbi:MAG TPA: RhuM family protein [Dokdonella sp.]|uniref:RhuM family protein n=1 Tax=Dokdonella sp. TaxID=2291710 RepID=UPI002D7E90CB|nr:RhuM family protein [Dokdonella sp.]HET9033878.1 RhuM family protein [Dokdonella sp.]
MSDRRRSSLDFPTDIGASAARHGELVVYPAEHAAVWLSQMVPVEPFQTSAPNINMKNVSAEGELRDEASIQDNLIVRTERSRIETMFLDYDADRAKKRQDIRMADWRQYVDNFIDFNERPLLKGAGRISHERMQQVAHERYAEFDAKRRQAEALAADVEDIKELEQIERTTSKKAKS